MHRILISAATILILINYSFAQNLITEEYISQINIPHRSYEYQDSTDIIFVRSSEELHDYFRLVETRFGDMDELLNNYQPKHISILKSLNFDFGQMNLLIVTLGVGSGTATVTLEKPVWQDQNAVINIKVDYSTSMTDDMAYYGYAFTIAKTIPKIIVNSGNRVVEIKSSNN